MRVHQLLSGAGPVDAVTAQAQIYKSLMADWGMGGDIYAGIAEPPMDRRVRPAARLSDEIRRDDAILIHYSAYSRHVSAALDLPNPKLLVYHNITPASYLWDYNPLVAAFCAIGRDELPRFAGAVRAAAAVSSFNARELEEVGFSDVEVIPNLLDSDRLREGSEVSSRWADGKRNVIFVGRIAPHKRHDDLIRAFTLFQRRHEPDSRLILAGSPLSADYRRALEEFAEALGATDVVFTGPLPQHELNAAYVGADIFLCLSEHEGFCIPLLEAMHFRVPVIAYTAGGVPEVAGDAAVLLSEKPAGTVAEAMAIVLEDDELRREMLERGRRRLAHFSSEETQTKLRSWIEESLT